MKTPSQDTPRGFAFALVAYLIWGAMPVYMKAMEDIPTLEVLAHRVIWSVPIALAILIWLGRTTDLMRAFRTPAMLGMGMVTAAVVSINWGTYVWAVQNGQTIEAALGYYINPLFSILLGRFLLGERLSRLQWVAVGLAGLAVAILTFEAGRLPLVALTLTFSWGFYAYFKRALPIGPNQGFALEVILLLPFALGYALWLGASRQAVFLNGDLWSTGLLLGCGVITAVPLMIYANGAKLLRLSTIGIMQYLTPTFVFLIAVFAFGEPFGQAKAIAFPVIWAALALYSFELIRRARAPSGA
jgi:chloramphenicol-sensitive protein RarD